MRTLTSALGLEASVAMISSAICTRRILAAAGATAAEPWNDFAFDGGVGPGGVGLGGVGPGGIVPGGVGPGGTGPGGVGAGGGAG